MLLTIPLRLFTDKRMLCTDYKIYAYLFANRDNPVPYVKDIASTLGSSQDAIANSIARLELFNYIKKQIVTDGEKKIQKYVFLDLPN